MTARWALPVFTLIWTAMTGLIIYGWLSPEAITSGYWLESWYRLMLGLTLVAGVLIVLILWQHRRSLNVLAKAMPDIVNHGVGYQIRDAEKFGEEAVLFNRLSRRLASTLADMDSERELLNETLNNVDGVIVVVDGQGKIDLVTPYAEKVFGWRQDQLVNHPISLFLPQYAEIIADIATSNDSVIHETVEQHSIARCEYGEIKGVSIQLHTRKQTPGHVMLVRDVTAELEAEREAQLLKDALDSSNEGVMLFDSNDQLIWANSCAHTLLTDDNTPLNSDQTYSEIMTQAVVQGLFPDAINTPDIWLQDAQSYHQGSEESRDIRQKSGKWLRERSLSTRHGGILSIYGDITADKESEQLLEQKRQLAEASRDAKGHFLAVMSHEIRTPLNGMMGMLELLQTETAPSQRNHYIKTALEAGSSLALLINDLLDLSRLDAEKLQLNNQPCQLVALTQSVIDLVQPLAQKKSLSLAVNINDHLPDWVSIDAGRLRQVLLNLLGNAIKFTAHGRVTLDTRMHDGKLRFTVQDTGPGMTPEQLKHLFKAFSMLGSDYNRTQEGAGLGLAISQRLIERMGGCIQVASTPGKGSQFWFELTLAQVEPPEQCNASANTETNSCYILLAEDNETNRMMAEHMLVTAGHKVDIACNGEEAVAAVQKNHYQMVLMDISMPVMDGIEATRSIRALPEPDAEITIIAMTAHDQPEEKAAFKAAGMNDYLHKPMRRDALLSMVARWNDNSSENTPPVLIDSIQETIPPDAYSQLDISALQQMAQDVDDSVFPQLIELFIRNARERKEVMSNALSTQDYECLEREVHSLKSSAAAYGLVRIQQLATEVEQQCKRGEFQQVSEPADRLLLELEPALTALEDLDYKFK